MRNSLLFTGFTLIELLVVVAVIAILLTILLPGLRRAKSLAMTAVCQSNMKQIGSMLALYGSDCDGYVAMPGSSHSIFKGNAFGYSLTNMTTASYPNVTDAQGGIGGKCPDGDNRLHPASFGWFYTLGYLPPGLDPGNLHCPGMGIFRNYGRDQVTYTLDTYNAYSKLTKDLARADGKYTNSVWGGNWDCEGAGMISYFHRGWKRTAKPTALGGTHGLMRRIKDWNPTEAVAVDFERYDWYSTWKGKFLDSHGNGLNILFNDGSVVFGGKRIGNYEPFVYYGMTLDGRSFDQASGISGTWASSGRVYDGSNGQQALWQYYESARK